MQVHHIVPGDDNIENGIPLCPNCHDETHTQYSPGRTTRAYTPTELKLHRQRTIAQVKREGNMTREDDQVYTTLMSAEQNATDHLLDKQLPLIRHKISRSLQEMVIDAINHRWKENPSWTGTINPMKWFDIYFDFFVERQYPYLVDVFKELTSSTRSIKAQPYSSSVVKKITPAMLSSQDKKFIYACAEVSVNVGSKNKDLASDKLRELRESRLVTDSNLIDLMDKVIRLFDLSRRDEDYQELNDEIYEIVYPNARLRRRTRRST